MNNNLSETNFSEVHEQSAKPLPVTEPKVQTLITSTLESNMTKIPSEENPQIETPSLQAHEDNAQPPYDLSTVRNFVSTTITLLQEFLKSSDEKGETNTPAQSTQPQNIAVTNAYKSDTVSNREPITVNINAQSSQKQETETNTQLTTQSPSSSKNFQEAMMQRLQTIHHQIGRIHQLQTDQNQKQLRKKPETRACFRCEKMGHVAKFCRSKPKQFQQTRLHQNRQQRTNQRYRKQLHPTSHNSSVYDPLHNWQLTTLQSGKNLSSRKTIAQHKPKLNQVSPQKSSLTPATHSE